MVAFFLESGRITANDGEPVFIEITLILYGLLKRCGHLRTVADSPSGCSEKPGVASSILALGTTVHARPVRDRAFFLVAAIDETGSRWPFFGYEASLAEKHLLGDPSFGHGVARSQLDAPPATHLRRAVSGTPPYPGSG